MVITYNGLEFFKVQSGGLTLAFNPVSKSSKSKIPEPRFRCNVALVSLNHPDFNGVSSLLGNGGEATFVVNSAGEYGIEDIAIMGFGVKVKYGGKEAYNTIYKVTLEKINLCFLGALDSEDVDENILGQLDDIDILFVPIGGGDVLSPSEAQKLAVKISPSIIIPMHFDPKNGDLKKFLKEEGGGKVKAIDKLSIKKNILNTKDGEIVLLRAV